jgi:hypothetical protein
VTGARVASAAIAFESVIEIWVVSSAFRRWIGSEKDERGRTGGGHDAVTSTPPSPSSAVAWIHALSRIRLSLHPRSIRVR